MCQRAILSILIVILHNVNCKATSEINTEIQTYNKYINASVELEKQDKMLINIWMEQLQVKQVNITSSYRLQMTRHKEHSFKRKLNQKWRDCIEIYKNEINKSERKYYHKEGECLKTAASADNEKKLAVHQIEREIRKWKKSYRYLQSLCHRNHPDNEEDAGVCLVEYMQKDNYNLAIQRLLILKLESMGELYQTIATSINNLEHCLQTGLSGYLENVRIVMVILNRCYAGTKSNY